MEKVICENCGCENCGWDIEEECGWCLSLKEVTKDCDLCSRTPYSGILEGTHTELEEFVKVGENTFCKSCSERVTE